MKISAVLSALAFAVLAANSWAQIGGDPDVMTARGSGTITHEEFEARLHRIPERHRFQFIRDRARMEDTLEQMLTSSQLAADAKAKDFTNDPVIKARMDLAAKEELARAWLEHVVATAEPANYTAMAREEYKLNRERFQSPHTVDVSHILISTQARSDEEALKLAQDIRARLVEEPEKFRELALEYSEDPSVAGNKGSFAAVKQGDMVPEFEQVAFALAVGDLSEPVKTEFGYHVIRKDGEVLPEQMEFKDVRRRLEQRMKRRYEEQVREEYLLSLYAEETELSQTSIENGLERVFGREVLAKYNEEGESQ